MDTPLYAKIDGATSAMARKGLEWFRLFDDEVYHLTELVRQQGCENEEFRRLLENLATGQLTEADYDRWSTRALLELPPAEHQEFEQRGGCM